VAGAAAVPAEGSRIVPSAPPVTPPWARREPAVAAAAMPRFRGSCGSGAA